MSFCWLSKGHFSPASGFPKGVILSLYGHWSHPGGGRIWGTIGGCFNVSSLIEDGFAQGHWRGCRRPNKSGNHCLKPWTKVWLPFPPFLTRTRKKSYPILTGSSLDWSIHLIWKTNVTIKKRKEGNAVISREGKKWRGNERRGWEGIGQGYTGGAGVRDMGTAESLSQEHSQQQTQMTTTTF